MTVDLDLAFADVGGVPADKAIAVDHLQRIPISASLRRRYLREWSNRTGVSVSEEDYRKLGVAPRER